MDQIWLLHSLFIMTIAEAQSSHSINYLQKLFKAIDTCLCYYFATAAKNHISFADLQLRVARNARLTLRLQHLQQIKSVWNDAFSLYEDQSGYHVSVSSLPLNPKLRWETFLTCCLNHGLSPVSLHPIEDRVKRTKRPALDRLESLRKSPHKPQLVTDFKKKGSLIDRIRAKEQAAKLNSPEKPQQDQDEKFINSQLEPIAKVLVTLTDAYAQQTTTCLSLQELFKKLSDSLKSKLSSTETLKALETLSERLPKFCTIVYTGNIKAVRIYHGWTHESVRRQLNVSETDKSSLFVQ